jgi:2-polyprenyl-3-methyl-5-hydroxy-6-metoxy-1,4-benzoquinol methylase
LSSEIISQRNYWNREADDFQKIYTHHKSGLSNLLDRIFRKDMYERFVFTIENCAPVRGRRFLDVGCGNGLYSARLAREGAAQVTGIDIAENMIALCRQSAQRESVEDRCTFMQTQLLEYTPDSSFDVAIGIGLFDYISDPLPVLKKMREVTTDKAIVSFPRFWTWRAPIRKARLTLRNCSVFFYTRRKIARLMREAGFDHHRITRVGKLHCVVAYSNEKRQAG